MTGNFECQLNAYPHQRWSKYLFFYSACHLLAMIICNCQYNPLWIDSNPLWIDRLDITSYQLILSLSNIPSLESPSNCQWKKLQFPIEISNKIFSGVIWNVMGYDTANNFQHRLARDVRKSYTFVQPISILMRSLCYANRLWQKTNEWSLIDNVLNELWSISSSVNSALRISQVSH